MGRASGVCGGKGGSQHLCNDGFYSNGVLGSIVPVATGMALAERERGSGAVDRRLPRRRHARPGRRLREPQHRLALGLADAVRRREQLLRAVDAQPPDAGRRDRRRAAARSGSRRPSWPRPTWLEVRTPRQRSCPSVRATARPFFLVLDTYRFSPHSKGDDDRDPAEIEAAAQARSAGRRGRAAADEHERRQIEDACRAAADRGDRRRGRCTARHARGGLTWKSAAPPSSTTALIEALRERATTSTCWARTSSTRTAARSRSRRASARSGPSA